MKLYLISYPQQNENTNLEAFLLQSIVFLKRFDTCLHIHFNVTATIRSACASPLCSLNTVLRAAIR